jgi:hypothetical protein
VIQPQRIGRFLHIDGFGYVQPDAAIDLVGRSWRPLVDFVTRSLMTRRDIRSVYLRGSIPRGLAIENVSDADFIYISETDFDREDAALEATTKVNFPFIQQLKLFRLNRTELNRVHHPQRRPYFHMLLKTQSLLLAGDDVAKDIEPFKLGPDMINHVFWLEKEFKKTLLLAPKVSGRPTDSQEATIERALRKWISKRIVRSGLEITIYKNSGFTRDLYLCYEAFSMWYPRQSSKMYRALMNSLNGHEDPIVYKDLVALLIEEGARLPALNDPSS